MLIRSTEVIIIFLPRDRRYYIIKSYASCSNTYPFLGEQFRRKIPNELTMEKRITIVLFILSTMFTSKYPVSCTKISSRITFDSQNGGEKLDLNEVGSTDF